MSGFMQRFITFESECKVIFTQYSIRLIFNQVYELFVMLEEFLLQPATFRKCTLSDFGNELGLMLLIVATVTVQRCRLDSYFLFALLHIAFLLEFRDIWADYNEGFQHVLPIQVLFLVYGIQRVGDETGGFILLTYLGKLDRLWNIILLIVIHSILNPFSSVVVGCQVENARFHSISLIKQPEGGRLNFAIFIGGADQLVELGGVDVNIYFGGVVELDNILIFVTLQKFYLIHQLHVIFCQFLILVQQHLFLFPHTLEHHLVLLQLLFQLLDYFIHQLYQLVWVYLRQALPTLSYHFLQLNFS